jgi:hypothetical protein
MKDPEQLQQQIDKLKEELESSREIQKRGWILLDFPSTFT